MNPKFAPGLPITGKAALILLALISVSACGGNSSSPPPPVTPPTSVTPPAPAEKVIGAVSIAVCEQAANNDTSDCYVIDGTTAKMYGVIDGNSLADYQKLRSDYPEVTEIILIAVPGSSDDEENVKIGRALHNDKLNTRLLANSEISSGGVDYFLAGVERRIESGARVGVHAWSDGSGTNPADLPRDHPSHKVYLDYYSAIEYSEGEDFYFFTINAAPASDLHWMTNAELDKYKMTTQASSQSVSSKNGGVAYIKSEPRYLGRHIVNVEPTSYANIIGDEADTDFYVNVQGVHFLDGGPGNNRLYVQGSAEDYWKTEDTDGKTILFDRRADQNMTLHLENIEHIEFLAAPER